MANEQTDAESGYMLTGDSIEKLREDHEILRSIVSSSLGRRLITRPSQYLNETIIHGVLNTAITPGSIFVPSSFEVTKLVNLTRTNSTSTYWTLSSGRSYNALNHNAFLTAGPGSYVVIALASSIGRVGFYVPVWVEESCVF